MGLYEMAGRHALRKEDPEGRTGEFLREPAAESTPIEYGSHYDQ
jgi:hypothetical protein